MKNKDLHYYLDLPWTYTIETCFDENQKRIFILRVNELPGVCTDAPTIAEAMELIKEAMTASFRLYMKQNEEIPEPINPNEFAGNISYRTTSKRHYMVAREAQRQAKSLSKVIDECIDSTLSFNQKHRTN